MKTEVIVLTILSAVAAYRLPHFAYQYACYKQNKKGRAQPEGEIRLWQKLLAAVVAAGYTLFAGWYLPFTETVFATVFMMFAIFGITVDQLIRIIGNEMVGWMFLVAVIYRIYSGGVKSLLNALLAIGCVIAYFALADLIVRLHKGVRGVGMGDVKLAMVIALAVGFPNIYYFVLGMVIAMVSVILYRIIKTPVWIKLMFDTRNTFPMCGPIMVGLLFTIVQTPICKLLGLEYLCIV